MDWYQLCKLLDQPVWTEPFMDYNPEGIYSKEMIASYCKPIKDENGEYIGTFFVHPDTTKLFYQTIFTQTLEQPDTAMTGLGRAMLRGEEGMRQLKVDGEDCYVFYKPLGDTGWKPSWQHSRTRVRKRSS